MFCVGCFVGFPSFYRFGNHYCFRYNVKKRLNILTRNKYLSGFSGKRRCRCLSNDTFPPLRCCTSSQPSPQTERIGEPSTVWELDFYSRPVYGEDNKRIWELIVVDENLHLCHVESVPNNMINSTELRKRLERLLEQVTVKPTVVKFYRMPMFNMISLALKDLGFEVKPSRRTYRLYHVLREREEHIYSKMPGYSPEKTLSSNYLYSTERLPDALRGEKFAFCTASYSMLYELQNSGTIPYCDIFHMDDSISLEDELPGMIVYSQRAESLACWTAGAELSFIKFLEQEQELVLECGISSHYRLAKIAKDEILIEEAKTFEQLKRDRKGFHFYAIESLKENSGKNSIQGLWLLNDMME